MRRIFLNVLMLAVTAMSGYVLPAMSCEPVDANWSMSTESSFDALSKAGTDAWYYNSQYSCATVMASSIGQDGEAWLLTPAYDLREMRNVTFSFEHAHRYWTSPEKELNVYVCSNYTDLGSASWTKLNITYSSNENWSWVSNAIDVPKNVVGAKTVFGFCCKNQTSSGMWEVKRIHVQSSCKEGDTPAGRMRICGQNMENYYFHYDNYESKRANYDHAAFAAKTKKIVNSFLKINADVYALCEIEACSEVLSQLVDSLNKYAEENLFAVVTDGIYEAWDKTYDNNMKSGFIYRKDKVKPVGKNAAASTWNYYKNTMRIQAFEELSSGEQLVVSMNHFKAKTGDGGDETRKDNASHLISALKKSYGDPDILILGDLNCEVNEDPIQMLIKAGYAEQLLRFDASSYSHCYGGGELIDHVLANTSMSQQIVDAKVYHVCTLCGEFDNYASTYSDHDPYVVDMNLGEYNQGTIMVNGERLEEKGQKLLIDGRLYIIVGEEMYDMTGNRVQK